jgi:hypothetical protein
MWYAPFVGPVAISAVAILRVSVLKETLKNPGHGQETQGTARVFRRHKLSNRGFPELL